MTYSFEMPGDPVPKGRPRHTAKGVTFTPERTRRAERDMAFVAKAAAPKGPLAGPLCVELTFACATRRRQDWDNLGKLVCDACNGILWEDDSQIEDAHVVKRIGVGAALAKTSVRVEQIETTDALGIIESWEERGGR